MSVDPDTVLTEFKQLIKDWNIPEYAKQLLIRFWCDRLIRVTSIKIVNKKEMEMANIDVKDFYKVVCEKDLCAEISKYATTTESPANTGFDVGSIKIESYIYLLKGENNG